MKKIFGSIAALGLAGLLITGVTNAATQQLQVNHTVAKTILGSWEGGDVTPTSGGDGTITLSASSTAIGSLKVRCNSRNGYSLKFQAANATGATGSKIKFGAGGTAATEISYTATLDVSQFSGTSNITTNALNLQTNAEALRVKFDNPGNVLPMSAANANQVKINFVVTPFDPLEKEEGLYTDTITVDLTVM